MWWDYAWGQSRLISPTFLAFPLLSATTLMTSWWKAIPFPGDHYPGLSHEFFEIDRLTSDIETCLQRIFKEEECTQGNSPLTSISYSFPATLPPSMNCYSSMTPKISLETLSGTLKNISPLAVALGSLPPLILTWRA